MDATDFSVFERLPYDMVVEILSRVGQEDSDSLFSSKLVCKEFLLAAQDNMVLSKLSFEKWPTIDLWPHPELVLLFNRCLHLYNRNALIHSGLFNYFHFYNSSENFISKPFKQGYVCPTLDELSDIYITRDVLIKDVNDLIDSIISNIYPDFIHNLGNTQYYQERSILAPTHEIVNIINDKMMDSLDAKQVSYLSSDSISHSDLNEDLNTELYTQDFLNSIDISGLPKHNLRLKVGVPVMLLRNIDPAGGLCNGTRLQIVEAGVRIIKAKILTGTHVGNITFIPRMLIVCLDKRIPFKFQRRQFPLSICFAMTINNCEGQSLSIVGLFLPKPVLNHGQLYVSLSHLTTKQCLKVFSLEKDNKVSKTTTIVIYN